MRKQCKRRKVAKGIIPMIFKHCESAETMADDWKDRILGLYFSMIGHRFTDEDCREVIDFILLCSVIGSVAKSDDYDKYVKNTLEMMRSPYRRMMTSGKWIFTTDEAEDLRERMMALIDAIAKLPKLTIKFAKHDVNYKRNAFFDKFKRDAMAVS